MALYTTIGGFKTRRRVFFGHLRFAFAVLLFGKAKEPPLYQGHYSPEWSPPVPYKLPDPDHDPHKTPLMNPLPVDRS